MEAIDLELSVTNELRRKTFEEMSRIMQRYESGRLTLSQVQAAVTTLWNVTSGLVQDEDYEPFFSAMTGEINNTLRNRGEPSLEEFHLLRGGSVDLLVTRKFDADDNGQIEVTKLVCLDSSTRDLLAAGDRHEIATKIDTLLKTLKAAGFKLVAQS